MRNLSFLPLAPLLAFGWATLAVAGQPDLLLHPTRIVFDRAVRSAQIDLVNTSSQVMTYRLRMVDRRMDVEGRLLPAPAGEAQDDGSAAAMLRFSPRQVVLPPGGSQTVRIMVRKSPDLAPGEYRSHLLFERIAAVPPAAAANVEQELQIELTALVSVSIPIIVRHGDTQGRIGIVEPQLHRQAGGDVLSFLLQREGNRSVFGDLVATWVAVGGAETTIGQARGVAVYARNPARHIRLGVTMPPGAVGGYVRIEFRDRREDGNDANTEARLAVQ